MKQGEGAYPFPYFILSGKKCSCGRRPRGGIIKSLRRAMEGEKRLVQYKVKDQELDASRFLSFVNKVWPGDYDLDKTQSALMKTLNITAYEDDMLVGCLRILSDGYYFGTITELLVLPEYRRQGIGSELLRLAGEHTPTKLYFGAQSEAEGFYERNGCRKSLQSYLTEKERR